LGVKYEIQSKESIKRVRLLDRQFARKLRRRLFPWDKKLQHAEVQAVQKLSGVYCVAKITDIY
jgi:hypothetical protein